MNIDSNQSVFNNQYTNLAQQFTRQGNNKLGFNQISNCNTLNDKTIQSSPAQVYRKKKVPKNKLIEAATELVPPTESPPDEEESQVANNNSSGNRSETSSDNEKVKKLQEQH